MLSHFQRNDIKKAFLILCKERSSIKKHIKKIHFFKSISRLLLPENYPSVFLALQFSVDRPCKYVFDIKFQFFLSSCHSLNYLFFVDIGKMLKLWEVTTWTNLVDSDFRGSFGRHHQWMCWKWEGPRNPPSILHFKHGQISGWWV